jgi:hypothetical protein
MNICNISSIEPLVPTQKLGLRGGFETTSNIFLDAAPFFGLSNPCFVQMLDVELKREPR